MLRTYVFITAAAAGMNGSLWAMLTVGLMFGIYALAYLNQQGA